MEIFEQKITAFALFVFFLALALGCAAYSQLLGSAIFLFLCAASVMAGAIPHEDLPVFKNPPKLSHENMDCRQIRNYLVTACKLSSNEEELRQEIGRLGFANEPYIHWLPNTVFVVIHGKNGTVHTAQFGKKSEFNEKAVDAIFQRDYAAYNNAVNYPQNKT